MEERKLIEFQEQQIKILQEEKLAALEALELTRTLGDFYIKSHERSSRFEFFQEVCLRAGKMIPFEAAAVYLVDDETQDFTLEHVLPAGGREVVENEVQSLIADQSFAFALQSKEPVFFLDSTRDRHLLLHVLATPLRVRGMFVGLMPQRKGNILDTTLKLFSVVMQSAVHALDNMDSREIIRNHNEELESKVLARTQELRDAHDRFKTTIAGMQAGVLLIDASNHRIVDANPMALKMIGYTWDEIVGKECFEIICTAMRGHCPILDKGMEESSGEYLIEREDGVRIPIHKTVSKVMIGGKLHLVENFVDITEQKKLADLREHVDRIMRHDLKGPLNGVIALPEVLLLDDNLTESQREILEYIKGAGYKLLNMINMSLDLYKMETGTYKYSPSSTKLVPVINSVLKDLSEQITFKKIKVRLVLDGSELDECQQLMIMAEELLIYSLFSNLLRNAVEASPMSCELRIEMFRRPDSSLITVHNQGAVPENIRDNFFEKYVTEGKSGGTGLGTYSARLIVETMGGVISMSSSEAGGTNVSFELPVCIDSGTTV